MRGLQAAITVVGLLFLLGVSYPLVAFVVDLANSKSGVYLRQEGRSLVVDFDYRGSVELRDVRLEITLIGSRSVSKGAEADEMVNGSHLTIKIPINELPSDLRRVRMRLYAEIGGIFPLSISREVEVRS